MDAADPQPAAANVAPVANPGGPPEGIVPELVARWETFAAQPMEEIPAPNREGLPPLHPPEIGVDIADILRNNEHQWRVALEREGDRRRAVEDDLAACATVLRTRSLQLARVAGQAAMSGARIAAMERIRDREAAARQHERGRIETEHRAQLRQAAAERQAAETTATRRELLIRRLQAQARQNNAAMFSANVAARQARARVRELERANNHLRRLNTALRRRLGEADGEN